MPASPERAARGDLAPYRHAVLAAAPPPRPRPIASPQPRPGPRRRLAGADLLRAVAVVGVVAIHAGAWAGTSTSAEAALWHGLVWVARFSVPAFVVLAGVVLEFNRRGPLDARDFVRRRALRTFVPWLAWAPLYWAFGALVTGQLPRTVPGAAGWLAYGGGHLYFLLLIPQHYIAFLVWPRRLRSQLVIAAGAVAVQTALCVVRLQGIVPHGLEGVVEWHAFQEAPFWIGYFAAGVALGNVARSRPWFLRRRAVVACGACLVAVGGWLVLAADPIAAAGVRTLEQGTGAFLRPVLVLLVAGVVLLALGAGDAAVARRPRLRVAADRVSRDALGIYIVQAALLYPLGRWLQWWLSSPSPAVAVTAFLVLLAATLGGSMAATEVLARTRLRVAVGMA